MSRIRIYTEGEQQWMDLADKSPDQVIHVADDADFALAVQKSADNSVSATMCFRLDLPTGVTVLFRTSLPLFLLVADLLRKQFMPTPREKQESTLKLRLRSVLEEWQRQQRIGNTLYDTTLLSERLLAEVEDELAFLRVLLIGIVLQEQASLHISREELDRAEAFADRLHITACINPCGGFELDLGSDEKDTGERGSHLP